MPAQRVAGRDERHQIAVLELAVNEAGERGLGAIAFGRRQVEVVEEEHEGARRPGVDPGVGAVAEASRRALRLARYRGGADGLEERDRLRPAFVLDLEIGGGEIADRLAVLADDDGVDDDQVGAGAKSGLSRRPLRLLGAEPGGEEGHQHKNAGGAGSTGGGSGPALHVPSLLHDRERGAGLVLRRALPGDGP